ncbi:MAG TPA: peptidoglycan-binding protein [Candidatus Saccharimonadales bacterium]|nr:peptidoglycan-binding protein [Candidatus Saccharimonadales bacterium]
MPKTKTRSKNSSRTKLKSRLLNMSRRNFIIMSVFVLIFVGVGGFIIVKPKALPAHDCYARTYRYAPNTYYWCVVQLQTSLNILQRYYASKGMLPVGYPDGLFGPATLSAVKALQRNDKAGSSVDGVVGTRTWYDDCWWLEQAYRITLNQNDRTWSGKIDDVEYNIGCSYWGL